MMKKARELLKREMEEEEEEEEEEEDEGMKVSKEYS